MQTFYEYTNYQRSLQKMSAEQLEYAGLSDQVMDPRQLDKMQDDSDDEEPEPEEYHKEDTRDDDNDYDTGGKKQNFWGPPRPSPDKDLYQSVRGHDGKGKIIPDTERPVFTTLKNRSPWFRGLPQKSTEYWFKMRVSSMRIEMMRERDRLKKNPQAEPRKDWDYDLILRAAREDATRLNAGFYNQITTNRIHEAKKPPRLPARSLVVHRYETHADMKRRSKNNGIHYGEAENPGPSGLWEPPTTVRQCPDFLTTFDIAQTLIRSNMATTRTYAEVEILQVLRSLGHAMMDERPWACKIGNLLIAVVMHEITTIMTLEWTDAIVLIVCGDDKIWFTPEEATEWYDRRNHNPMSGHRIGEASNPGPSDLNIVKCAKGISCSQRTWWHKKEENQKNPKCGAGRRIAEKKSEGLVLCKLADAVLCETPGECTRDHGHIVRQKKGVSDPVADGLRDDEEEKEGERDAFEEMDRDGYFAPDNSTAGSDNSPAPSNDESHSSGHSSAGPPEELDESNSPAPSEEENSQSSPSDPPSDPSSSDDGSVSSYGSSTLDAYLQELNEEDDCISVVTEVTTVTAPPKKKVRYNPTFRVHDVLDPVDAPLVYSVCGMRSTELESVVDRKLEVIKRYSYEYIDGIEQHEDADLLRVMVPISHRDYHWFKTIREIPRKFKDIFTKQSWEDPQYYGNTRSVYGVISKSALEKLERQRGASSFTEMVADQALYLALTNSDAPPWVCRLTHAFWVSNWTIQIAQRASLYATYSAFLKAKKVPMSIPEDLRMRHNILAAQESPVPRGEYHMRPIPGTVFREELVPTGDMYGSIDKPTLKESTRFTASVTKGCRMKGGYIKFNTQGTLKAYMSRFVYFVTGAGTVEISTAAYELAVLRLTIDKEGNDLRNIQNQANALWHPEGSKWIQNITKKCRPTPMSITGEEGWAMPFVRAYCNVMRKPYDDEDAHTATEAYIAKIGVDMAFRRRVNDDIAQLKFPREKHFLIAKAKAKEKNKMKTKEIAPGEFVTLLSYVRLFIGLSGANWRKSLPHLISRMKDSMSKTIIWTQHGLITDEGHDPTPNPGLPLMHTTLLYPVVDDKMQVDGQHMASHVAKGIEFVKATKGIASFGCGDDTWFAYWDVNRVRFACGDVVNIDMSHTPWVFAILALLAMACGCYEESGFKDMTLPVRLENPSNPRHEYAVLLARLGMILPTGSPWTTSCNSMVAMLIALSVALHGFERAGEIIGYDCPFEFFDHLEESTFLAHFFYETDDALGIGCHQCPSVLFRSFGGTPGDFVGKATESFDAKGLAHCVGVTRGLKHWPSHYIVDGFRKAFHTGGEVFTQLTPENFNRLTNAMCRRANITEDQLKELGGQISRMEYGSVVASPVVDAFCRVRYALPDRAA